MGTVRNRTVTVKVRTDGPATVTVKVRPEAKRTRHRGLRFTNGNSKLDQAIFILSLPAGYFCPFAQDCLSKANRKTGHIKDGPHTQFRCYAASGESRGPAVRDMRWHNAKLLRACKTEDEMARLIFDSLSPFARYVRVHESGDFFSQAYFDAWMSVGHERPDTHFYAYTKSLPYWIRRRDSIPDNFVLTASYGGTHDHLIAEHGLRYSVVVKTHQQAADMGLEIDHDDSHAMNPGPSFALLVHGTQPAGSEYAKAVADLRAMGEFGYGQRADDIRRQRGRMPLVVIN
jgi:hypothetical protein